VREEIEELLWDWRQFVRALEKVEGRLGRALSPEELDHARGPGGARSRSEAPPRRESLGAPPSAAALALALEASALELECVKQRLEEREAELDAALARLGRQPADRADRT